MFITPLDIVLVCWLLLVIYWAFNWKKVKKSQSREWGFWYLRLIMAVLIGGFIIAARKLGVLPPCHQNWTSCYYNFIVAGFAIPLLQYIGVLVGILGLAIAVMARRTLGKNWSSTIDVKKDHELVTNGVYGYMRHPIYTGFLLLALATVLAAQSYAVLVFFASMAVVFLFRMHNEEKLMTKIFPKEYPQYKKKVKALIPFIW